MDTKPQQRPQVLSTRRSFLFFLCLSEYPASTLDRGATCPTPTAARPGNSTARISSTPRVKRRSDANSIKPSGATTNALVPKTTDGSALNSAHAIPLSTSVQVASWCAQGRGLGICTKLRMFDHSTFCLDVVSILETFSSWHIFWRLFTTCRLEGSGADQLPSASEASMQGGCSTSSTIDLLFIWRAKVNYLCGRSQSQKPSRSAAPCANTTNNTNDSQRRHVTMHHQLHTSSTFHPLTPTCAFRQTFGTPPTRCRSACGHQCELVVLQLQCWPAISSFSPGYNIGRSCHPKVRSRWCCDYLCHRPGQLPSGFKSAVSCGCICILASNFPMYGLTRVYRSLQCSWHRLVRCTPGTSWRPKCLTARSSSTSVLTR